MDWREFLEKDSLDGKQGHDPKKFEWDSHYTDNKEQITDMKPEDFQDLTAGQAGSDAHKKHPKNMFPEKKNPKTGKYEKQKPKRESFIDGKDDDDKRYPIDPKRSKDERQELYRERENRRQSSHRGDELGAVEGYKRQLRHGGKPEIPALGTRTDSQGRKHVTDHEGRHRAQAALEEGEKTIPVAVNHNRGSMALGREKRLNQKEIDEMGGEQGEPTSPRHNRDRISSGINSMHYHNQPKDKKIQQGVEALKSWEVWLKKETQPTGLTGKKLALWKKIQEDNKEDSDNQYYTKAWEEWLKKGKMDKFKKGLKNLVTAPDIYPSQIKHVKVDDEEKNKSWESWLEKGDDDEYHSVMNDVVNERKGSKYDKNTKQWTNPVGMPSRQHCGATSTSLANRGYGKKVSGKYHGTWDGKPEDHSWVENKDGHIIDASRDQFHGDKEQGIKTIKQNHPDYSKYKKTPNCPSCGTDKPPTKFTNLRTRCTGDNCNNFEDEAPEIFEKHHGRKHRDIKELNTFRKEEESQLNALHGIGKSWEVWLEKTERDWDPYDSDDRTPEEKERMQRALADIVLGKFEDENPIKGVKKPYPKHFINPKDKNNAIETSHKEDEKKHEWDGKFSSSTIRDDAENDDDKAVSEEESLEELTDGDLVEIEKLKSDVDKIITGLARKIKDPKRREDIVQRQADQKVKETLTKAWELFLVNKPMNQYDKQPQKKRTIDGDEKTLDTDLGIVKEPLTETVPIKNPRGSIGKKKVKQLDTEAGDGSRKIVEIPKKVSTNPESDVGGGRPEEPNVVGDFKHGSVNAVDGRRTGQEIQEGAENRNVLYNALIENQKEDEEKQDPAQTEDTTVISNDETEHATGVTEETPEARRAREIRQFDRKKRDKKGKIIKSWEVWLEKNEKWDKDEKKHNKWIKEQRKRKKDAIADMKAIHRNMREEAQRGDRVEDEEIMGDVKNPILYETQDKPRPTTSMFPPNLTTKKPRYVKGVEQKGDVADERDSLNVQIANSMKSWEGWLEKMQGAGDARFGNQHLTGLDQKPVNNEEDEANILPEKDEKRDEKEGKEEKTNNKPYKLLSED